MNNSNKSDPRAHLVAETFHADWTTGPAAVFARRAAAHARTRRIVRRIVLAGSAAAALALAFSISTHRTPTASRPAPAVSTAVPLSATAPRISLAQKTPAYEIISDTEFETLLRDRPLLILPREPEGRRIVLLAR